MAISKPEPSHPAADPAPPSQAPAAPANSDSITFTFNPHALSTGKNVHSVPMNSAHPISVRAIRKKIDSPIGIPVAQAAIFILSTVSAALLGASVQKESHSLDYGIYNGYSFVPIAPGEGLQLTPAYQVCLSALWALVALGISRLTKKPVHPAFYVAFDLLLWLSLLGICTGIIIIMGNAELYACTYDYRNKPKECHDFLRQSYKLQVAANTLALFSGMVYVINNGMKLEMTINMSGLGNAQAAKPLVRM
ncbi:hypothetical protein PRK78_000956 [Emydomyces testavorans]|uniref:Uncharacterized protein n=1 Tax=Emydomyces testavorans TaxID=2070801 RepID=A0AAF0IEZ5_9EURO|nr:hypothetical protein PRK78_000956 [Emydomyces testavorans]